MSPDSIEGHERVDIESILRYAKEHFGSFYVVNPTKVNSSDEETKFPHYQELTRRLKESEDNKPTP